MTNLSCFLKRIDIGEMIVIYSTKAQNHLF